MFKRFLLGAAGQRSWGHCGRQPGEYKVGQRLGEAKSLSQKDKKTKRQKDKKKNKVRGGTIFEKLLRSFLAPTGALYVSHLATLKDSFLTRHLHAHCTLKHYERHPQTQSVLNGNCPDSLYLPLSNMTHADNQKPFIGRLFCQRISVSYFHFQDIGKQHFFSFFRNLKRHQKSGCFDTSGSLVPCFSPKILPSIFFVTRRRNCLFY